MSTATMANALFVLFVLFIALVEVWVRRIELALLVHGAEQRALLEHIRDAIDLEIAECEAEREEK